MIGEGINAFLIIKNEIFLRFDSKKAIILLFLQPNYEYESKIVFASLLLSIICILNGRKVIAWIL